MKTGFITVMFAVLCFFTASAQWTWKNPLPQGNYLSDMQFISSFEGFACGEYGTVMRTADGGASWSVFRMKGEASFTYPVTIFMTGPDNGYVADYHGKIYRTQDGGATWAQTSDLTEYLSGLWFNNDSTGFVVGNDGLFLKTSDYGMTWENKNPGEAAAFTAIDFPDPLTGYAGNSNGTILKTTDGGETWFPAGSVDSLSVYKIRFADDSCGFATVLTGFIYRTMDGGNTWVRLMPADSSSVWDFWPFNRDTLLISGELFQSATSYLKRSFDGGMTWTVLPLPSEIGTMTHFSGFPDGTVYSSYGFAVCKSVDYGSAWQNLTTDIAGNVIADIHFPAENTGYALASFLSPVAATRILKTTDGGVTWDSVANLGLNCLNCLFFTNENHGIAAGNGVFQTWDGGLSWTQVNTGATGIFRSVFFPTVTRGFLAGDDGLLYRSDDCGQSWSRVSTGITDDLLCIHFPDPMHGYIGGWNAFMRTTDGGNTWTVTEPFGNDEIRSVFFVNPDTGYVCGQATGGCIYKTTDGGLNWENISCYAPLNGWYSCYFIDADTGYLAGYELYPVMKTTNGGRIWVPQQLPTGTFLNKIFFTTPLKGFAGGLQCALIGTTNGGYTAIGGKQDEPLPSAKIFPNPAGNSATVEYSVDVGEEVTISLYSMTGKRVMHLPGLRQQPGHYTLPLSTAGLPAGLYLCRISCGSRTGTLRIVVQH